MTQSDGGVGVSGPESTDQSGGTSCSYMMMYMLRGNRGGAETDGRAEDPFEAAACGASASALQVLLLPLLPPSKTCGRCFEA